MVVFFWIVNRCICCQVSLKEISEPIHAHMCKNIVSKFLMTCGDQFFFLSFPLLRDRLWKSEHHIYCCCHTAGDGGSKGGRGGTSQVTLGTNRFLAAPCSTNNSDLQPEMHSLPRLPTSLRWTFPSILHGTFNGTVSGRHCQREPTRGARSRLQLNILRWLHVGKSLWEILDVEFAGKRSQGHGQRRWGRTLII